MSAELVSAALSSAASLVPAKNNVVKNTGKAILATAKYAKEAQDKFGVNALELIRSGSGSNGGQQSQPRIASMAALTNSFDQISDVLSGRAAERGARQKVQDELAKVELETRRAELERYGEKVPRATSPGLSSKPVGVGTPTSNVPEIEDGRGTATSANHLTDGAWIDPKQPDAEMSETRYGDIMQEFAGARNLYADTKFNNQMERIAKTHSRADAQKVYDAYKVDRESTLEQVYKRLFPNGEAFENRPDLASPEKPTMREKPRAGWATEKFGNFNFKD